MTKKDYIKIADVINNNTDDYLNRQYKSELNRDDFINDLCKMFKKDNPNFNEKTFKKYTK